MRRWLGWIAIGWLLVMCAAALVASGPDSRPLSLAERTRNVALQLRCLVCQGESVADSPSTFSRSIRADIRRRLQMGQSSDEITSALARSYGDRVRLSPPASGVGSIAWLAPPFLVLGGAGLLVTLVVDWRIQGRRATSVSRDKYLERVRMELATSDEHAGE
ncbi:MAG: hypothetical protein PVSMB7_08830 [Chloroflexota bacterium]